MAVTQTAQRFRFFAPASCECPRGLSLERLAKQRAFLQDFSTARTFVPYPLIVAQIFSLTFFPFF